MATVVPLFAPFKGAVSRAVVQFAAVWVWHFSFNSDVCCQYKGPLFSFLGSITALNPGGQPLRPDVITENNAPLVTATSYDDVQNKTTVTLPDGSMTTSCFYPTGKLNYTYGSQTYPVAYAYDSQGRMTCMVTRRAMDDDGVTRWIYDSQRGWLTSKIYADGKGTGYTYTPAGRLLSRTWARQAGGKPLTTTYGYNTAGDLTSTVYSDNTPAVAITYNRLGQKLSSGNGASATVYGYDADTQRLATETVTGPVNRTLQRSYDDNGRPSGIAVLSGTAIEQQVGYGYDAAGRLATVTQGSGNNAQTFSYGYVPNSAGLIAALTGPILTTTNTWEPNRDVLASKQNQAGGTVVSQYDYVVNSLGQRVSVQHGGSAFTSGSAFNLYGYDSLGQLTSANRFAGNDLTNTTNPVSGQQFGFAFDNIGNRITASLDTTGTTSYTPNALNQYSAIQSGTSDAVAPVYDDDGNMLTDGTLTNQWDGENRLVNVTKADGTQIACAYDAQSRRVRKTVTSGSGSSVISDTGYIYDGWNVVAEYSLTTSDTTTTATLTAANTWGLDLSGSPQGAGGVGGLLSRTTEGNTYYYTYDGNGNVSELLDATGNTSAHYEYGPFGEPVRVSGAMAGQNPFRFSTKYTDDETGLLYYGYRYYNPSTGRWVNRDPIEEQGGLNLYAFVKNCSVDLIDRLGKEPPGYVPPGNAVPQYANQGTTTSTPFTNPGLPKQGLNPALPPGNPVEGLGSFPSLFQVGNLSGFDMKGKSNALYNALSQCGKQTVGHCKCCIVNINNTVLSNGASLWGGYGSVVNMTCADARKSGITAGPSSMGIPSNAAISLTERKLKGSTSSDEIKYYEW